MAAGAEDGHRCERRGVTVPDAHSRWQAVRVWEADGWQVESAERRTDGLVVCLVRQGPPVTG